MLINLQHQLGQKVEGQAWGAAVNFQGSQFNKANHRAGGQGRFIARPVDPASVLLGFIWIQNWSFGLLIST